MQNLAAAAGVDIVPTVFLRRSYLPTLREVMAELAAGRASGAYGNILGMAMEGPLLGRTGGIPPLGCWTPTTAEWRAIASLGPLGLRYLVIAPDAAELDEYVGEGMTFRDLVDLLAHNGVKLALGHFQAKDPHLAAARTKRLIDYVNERYGPAPEALVTDHLYNDMPRNFTHAWRTEQERARRDEELAAFLQRAWTPENLADVLGPVPAVLVQAAKDGLLLPMLNFDGAHVDLEICRRTVEYLGPERIIAITDHIETGRMAGSALHERPGSTLRYRDDGRVAAGSCDLDTQIRHMRRIGLDDQAVAHLTVHTPRAALRPLRVPHLAHR
ncbi:hypothetical protein ACFU5N_29220 [Streptomyces albidoflavus]